MKRRGFYRRVLPQLAAGAILFQSLGPCFQIVASTTTAALDFSPFIDSNGRLFGILAVCGQPNVQFFLEGTDIPLTEPLNVLDDLITSCPIERRDVTAQDLADLGLNQGGVGGGGAGGGGGI